MYNDLGLQPGKAQETSPTLASHTTATEQSWLYEKTEPPIALKLSNSTLILVPFSLIVLWTIVLISLKLQKDRRQHSIGRSGHRQFHALPCRRCVFFKDNPYLKCAINPIDALTENALNCVDYTPSVLRQK